MKRIILLTLACINYIQSGGASSWGYGPENGPDTWGTVSETCDTGAMQSPIDLNPRLARKNQLDDVDASIIFSDSFWTENAEGELFNNGHTVEFKVDLATNNFTFTGGPFGAETYQFLQLHFHWGSTNDQGSEHTIGGKRFPMEMHMVCINTKYINADGTLDGNYLVIQDGVAVLGFLFDVRRGPRKNQMALNTIIDGINELTAPEARSNEDASIPIEVDLVSFIEQAADGGYFTYDGSFTTPGCNEVVTWVNFWKPLKVSEDQLRAYRALADDAGNPLVDNFRPIQQLNERKIKNADNWFWLQ